MIRLIYHIAISMFLVGCASIPVPETTNQTPKSAPQSEVKKIILPSKKPFNPREEVKANTLTKRTDIPEYDIVPRARPVPEIDPGTLPPGELLFDKENIWEGTEVKGGLRALNISCRKILKRQPQKPFHKNLGVWGRVSDWLPLCQKLVSSPESDGPAILAEMTEPIRIFFKDMGGKFTGYFEPVYEARSRPIHPYTEPILTRPADLRIKGKRATQILPNGKTKPYPPRSGIDVSAGRAIAYAHPADVFFLQIQGSGRLELETGETIRAEYGGHNGHSFASTANWLIRHNHIRRSQASMQGIRDWMDRSPPDLVRLAMNANPRYIFFREAELGDPNQGPPGATGDRLTPLGSVAIDPKFIPYHLPLIIQTTAPGLGGKWRGMMVSQDTGNAIKGPIRGDLYFGTGYGAGQRAGTMNAPGKLWVLLPKTLTEPLGGVPLASTLYDDTTFVG